MKSDVLKAVGNAMPNGSGTIKRDKMQTVLKAILPSATNEELEILFGAVALPEGDINVKDFIDSLFAGVELESERTQDGIKLESQYKQSDTCSRPESSSVIRQDDPDVGKGNKRSDVGSPFSSPCPSCGKMQSTKNIALRMAEAAREVLPKRIILVRHGESEGNVDAEVYKRKPDNAVELTERGTQQALEVGKRIKWIIGNDAVQLIVSPFQRTLQTARNILVSIAPQVVQDIKDPRIREQEFGNMQNDDFYKLRKEQKTVGRYFYRFPTGESGADVHARVKNWWDSSLLQLNLRPGHRQVDTVVVVTHGLTMRFILMQLYDWSPNTFQTVFNAGNCEIYVLNKDLALPGHSPYVLCPVLGDKPRSSIELKLTFTSGEQKLYTLQDYLSIPMPRTRQIAFVKQMLHKQHGLRPDDIVDVDFYGGRFAKWK